MKLPSRLLRALLPVVAAAAAMSCSATSEDVGSNESALVVCGQTTVKGIDVYHGDNGGNPINWPAVKGAGISFAFAKATESTNFTDSAFATNWPAMKSAGLVRGAYHFFHADIDPVAQANFFLATVGAVSKGDLLVLDLEQMNGQTQQIVSAHALTFLATVKSATGVTPLLYTSPAFLSSFAGFGSYPLWVANYGVSCPNVPSPPWSTYTFWQSTGTGSLSVITGALDLDTFNGTLAQLIAFADGPPT
ncbi:MAG TPA: GH25 family lysozyme, partial [Polyangiaceae bacterium]